LEKTNENNIRLERKNTKAMVRRKGENVVHNFNGTFLANLISGELIVVLSYCKDLFEKRGAMEFLGKLAKLDLR
jgi:hypothetical protein